MEFSYLIIFSSPEPSFFLICLLYVVVVVVVNFSYFLLFSRTTGQFQPNFIQKHPWVEGIQICSHEGPSTLPRVDNNERLKVYSVDKIVLQNHWANFNHEPLVLELYSLEVCRNFTILLK